MIVSMQMVVLPVARSPMINSRWPRPIGSMASVRPSILATPSPSSRMLPTFCLAAAVLAPAICASISINRLLMAPRFLETLFERCQPSLHAAVIHVAAHLDAHPGDQRRAVGEGRGDVRAVAAHETRLDGSLHIRWHDRDALDDGRMAGPVQSQQPPKV